MKNLLLSLVVAAALSSTAARATTLTVTSTADDGTTAGTLRSVLGGAADGDTIEFSVTGAITLTTGQLVVDKSRKFQYELSQWDNKDSYFEV